MTVTRDAPPDRAARERLFAQVWRRAYGVAWAILQDNDDAQDVVVDAGIEFIGARIERPYDPSKGAFEVWFLRRVSWRSLNKLRARARHWEALRETPDDEEIVEERLVPEDVLLLRDHDARIKAVIDRLSPRHRTVIVLHYFVEMSVDEIAQELGAQPGTIKSRLHHARNALRRELGHDVVHDGDRERP